VEINGNEGLLTGGNEIGMKYFSQVEMGMNQKLLTSGKKWE
jgi:hypothetical protein